MKGVREEKAMSSSLSRWRNMSKQTKPCQGGSVLNSLFYKGNFDAIIKRILGYLNATQLACLQKVLFSKIEIF